MQYLGFDFLKMSIIFLRIIMENALHLIVLYYPPYTMDLVQKVAAVRNNKR